MTNNNNGKTIRIYTSPTCGFCHMLTEYLDDNNIEYEKIDISADAAFVNEMFELSGQNGIPVTVIWNENAAEDKKGEPTVIVGFDKAKIDEVLDIHGM